jgi:hypothetical protein
MPRNERRAEPRQPAEMDALMSRLGEFGAMLVTLRNVSATGAMGETADPPAVGEAVSLRLGADTTVVAVVVWKLEDRFGLKFEREVDPAEYTRF